MATWQLECQHQDHLLRPQDVWATLHYRDVVFMLMMRYMCKTHCVTI